MTAAMNVSNGTSPLQAFQERNLRFQTNVKEKPVEKKPEPVIESPIEAPEEGNTPVEEQPIVSNNEPSQTNDNPPEEGTEKQEVVDAKRYKEAQRKITAQAEALKAYNKLIEPFQNIIEYDDNGHPVKMDFSKVKPKEQPKANEPTEPTEAEWEEAQFDAKKMRELNKRQSAYELFQDRKAWKAEQEAERNKQKEEQIAQVFNETQDLSYKAACAALPGFGYEGHPVRLKAEEIARRKPHLLKIPDADWQIMLETAHELNMPILKSTPAKPLPAKSTMMNLGKSNSSTEKQNTNPHLQKFLEKQKRFLPKPY